MSDNKLKIDVVIADVGESGAVLSDFVTQELHNTDMAKKADLVDGKVNPTQLPEFSELIGVTDNFSLLESNLRENINTSLAESKAYADSIVSVVMSKKADLVNGRVPKEQATNFKDIPGAKAAIDGLKQSLGQEIIGISNSLENNFAKLTNGKVSQTVLPTNLVYSDRLTREMDDVRSTLQNTITQVDEELTALETKTNNKFISKTEAEYFTKDIELKAAIDGLEQKSNTSYASKIVETSKADLTYVDRALGALSSAATKFYPTLALANADIANLQVNQPVQVGEVENGGLWYKATAGATTLTKSAYDPLTQAKAYTDASLPVSKYGNLYNTSNNVTGVYVRSGDGLIVTETASVIAVIPVEAGKTYAIKSSSFAAAYMLVGLKANNNAAAGQTSTITSLASTSDATVKTFTVPVGSTAKFALINVKVASSFDVRTGFVVNEGESVTSTDPAEEMVQKIRGVNVADVKAREEIKHIKAQPYIVESDLVVGKSGNLYSQHTNGFYIVVGTGSFAANADSAVGIFPVKAGKTYAIKPGNFNASYFSIMLKADNVVGSGTGTNATGMLVATSDPAVKTLTVPVDSTAKYAMLNVKVASSFDIRSTLVVNEGTSITDTSPYKEVVKRIKGKKVEDEEARVLIKAVDDKVVGSIVSPLKDKTWVVIGDSITEVNFRTNKNYHAYVSDNVGGMTVYNYGQSGSGYYGRFNVAGTVTQDPDYVTVFFGTNDWQNSDAGNTKLLGVFGDTDNTTIAGCVYLCLSQLVSKFYNKRVAVFTPLPRSDNYGSNAAANARGFTLEQLAEVIKQTADHLSIPCLDLYHESNLPVWVYAGNQFYFTPPTGGSADGLHPNDEGHKIIARKVQKFLESI